jgi:PAS domain S-box-containing protein
VNVSPDIADHAPRILIVDDERKNRQLLEVMLAPEGFQLLTASSGEEALAMVAQQQPDVILLDVMMPGTNGYRVADQIKGNLDTKNIPIIMITALSSRDARMQALSAGAEDFLTKPVDRAELCMRVRNLSRLKTYGDYYEQQAAILAEQAALLDLAQDAIVALDLQSRVLFWSRGAEVMYGWLRAETRGRNATDLLRAEYSEPVELIQAVLLREGRWEGEAIHYRSDGRRLIVASRWALHRDSDGAPVRVLTINNDITHRKEADAERFLLTERLSLATAVAKVGVWEWELASDMLTWDATMFDIYCIPPVVSIPYARWSAMVHPEDLAAAEAKLETVIQQNGQGSGEYRIILADGSVRHISSVKGVVLDSAGEVIRLIGVNMDITDRKRLEEDIRASEETFRAAMEHASIGMALVEPGGRWLKVNSAICEMLGFTDIELLRTDYQSLTHTDDLEADLEIVRQMLAGTIHTYQIEKRYRRKDGHFIWALLNASLVRNADASPRYFVLQSQDITARKEVDRIKSEFIATVSHELRTPLTSIQGSLGLVAAGAAGPLPEKAAHLIDVAYSNAGRLNLIINDILDVEKIDCGKMTLDLANHSLAALVEKAVEENRGYAQSYQVRFVFPMALPNVMARVDPSRILQVLANILSNAAKYSPAEGSVEIGMTVDGATARISVTDHGPGIPASFRHRIFERFSQADGSDSRQKGGTGLGLTISKALVEQMGGTIGYESNAGIATTFFFELPVTTD